MELNLSQTFGVAGTMIEKDEKILLVKERQESETITIKIIDLSS